MTTEIIDLNERVEAQLQQAALYVNAARRAVSAGKAGVEAPPHLLSEGNNIFAADELRNAAETFAAVGAGYRKLANAIEVTPW